MKFDPHFGIKDIYRYNIERAEAKNDQTAVKVLSQRLKTIRQREYNVRRNNSLNSKS